jgi:hypothetical protein
MNTPSVLAIHSLESQHYFDWHAQIDNPVATLTNTINHLAELRCKLDDNKASSEWVSAGHAIRTLKILLSEVESCE